MPRSPHLVPVEISRDARAAVRRLAEVKGQKYHITATAAVLAGTEALGAQYHQANITMLEKTLPPINYRSLARRTKRKKLAK